MTNPIPPQAPFWGDMFANMSMPNVFPPMKEIERGIEMAKYDKYPIEVTEYKVAIFDMSESSDRLEYMKLMKDLFRKVQASQCVIARNELQVMGGTWKRYMEWFEYRKNEKSTTTKIPQGGGSPARKEVSDDE